MRRFIALAAFLCLSVVTLATGLVMPGLAAHVSAVSQRAPTALSHPLCDGMPSPCP